MATKSGSRKHGRAQSHESPPSGVPSSPWLGVHARRVLQASLGISRHLQACSAGSPGSGPRCLCRGKPFTSLVRCHAPWLAAS